MKALTAASLRRTAEKVQAQKEAERKKNQEDTKKQEELDADKVAARIMEDIEVVVLHAAKDGRTSVQLLSDVAVPKGAWDRGYLWDVTHRIRRKLEAAGSDLQVNVCDDPWPCEGGEGHIAIFASWGK